MTTLPNQTRHIGLGADAHLQDDVTTNNNQEAESGAIFSRAAARMCEMGGRAGQNGTHRRAWAAPAPLRFVKPARLLDYSSHYTLAKVIIADCTVCMQSGISVEGK
jgi:hypothetical protein